MDKRVMVTKAGTYYRQYGTITMIERNLYFIQFDAAVQTIGGSIFGIWCSEDEFTYV